MIIKIFLTSILRFLNYNNYRKLIFKIISLNNLPPIKIFLRNTADVHIFHIIEFRLFIEVYAKGLKLMFNFPASTYTVLT